MYVPSKRMIKKGLIPERGQYFNERGYEYTFVLDDYDLLTSRIKAMLEGLKGKNRWLRYKIYEDKPIIVMAGPGWQLEFYRKQHIDNNVRYILFNSAWEARYNRLQYGDEMNLLMTETEKVVLGIDPRAWVRELPGRPHVTNGIMSVPEKWEGETPIQDLTREEAAAKKLEEGFLADRLRAMGIQAAGGSDIAPNGVDDNPIIAERLARDAEKVERLAREAEEAARAAEEASKNPPAEQAAALDQEKIAPERLPQPGEIGYKPQTLEEYPPFLITEAGEPLDPFVHACLDENLELIEEPQDHGFKTYTLSCVTVKSLKKGGSKFEGIYTSGYSKDNILYVSDSRIAIINRKYNKKDAGTWIGFGGLTAYWIGEALTYAEKAVKYAQRRGKALAGHIRYEWISRVLYKNKKKFLDDEQINVTYKDKKGTTWLLMLMFPKNVNAAEVARDITMRIANYCDQATDEKSEKMQAFIDEYKNGKDLPVSTDPNKLSGVTIPEFYFATWGYKFRPGLIDPDAAEAADASAPALEETVE